MNNFSFSGFVLAGGKSSRMGRDKAYLKIGEKTFLENAVEILKPVCGEVKIVLNKSQTHFIENLPENISYIFDRFENRGAVGGIHAGLKDCPTDYAVILAVDLPFVTSESIQKLCEMISIEKEFSAIIPRQSNGKLQPLCAVYRVTDCLIKAEEILSKTESVSVKDFLETLNLKIIEAENLDKSQNLFLNINNQSEYKKIENYL